MTEENGIEGFAVGGPAKSFVSPQGIFMGTFASPPDNHSFYDVPAEWVEVPPPEAADQFWSCEVQSWGESMMLVTEREIQWRKAEMEIVADQLLRIEDGDPTALPGTDRQWRDYRIQLRAWIEGAEHFPDQAHRPRRPE